MVFFGFIMLSVLSVCNVTNVFAQPLEEEEEELQARPNPMEKTIKGGSKVMLKESLMEGAAKTEQMKGNVEEGAEGLKGEAQGKAGSVVEAGKQALTGEAQGKVIKGGQADLGAKAEGMVDSVGAANTGQSAADNSGSSSSGKKQLKGIEDETPNPLKAEGAEDAASKALFDGVDGESVPNSMQNQVGTSAASAYGWSAGGGVGPGGDPINPAQQVGEDWDPTDAGAADVSTVTQGQGATGYVGEGFGK